VSPSLQQDLDDCQDQYTDDMNDCGFSRLVAEALCNLL
jgi:hypothetical protein